MREETDRQTGTDRDRGRERERERRTDRDSQRELGGSGQSKDKRVKLPLEKGLINIEGKEKLNNAFWGAMCLPRFTSR